MLKKKSIIIAIVLAALAIGAAFVYVEYIYPKIVEPAETYSQARDLYNGGNYMQAAMKLESIPKYSNSASLAKQAWKLAGDSAYNEGDFDMASACYMRAGSNEEDVARMDECFLRLAENAFAKGLSSRGEIYLNCVTNSEENIRKMDAIRIDSANALLNNGINEQSVGSALDRLVSCSEEAHSGVVDMLIGWGKKALESFDMQSASSLFAGAQRLASESEQEAVKNRINDEWFEAGERALESGMESFAQKCFDICGRSPEIKNAAELYQQAVELYSDGKLFDSLALLRRLGDYGNSRRLADEIAEKIMRMPQAGADGAYAILGEDGTVKLYGDSWTTGEPDWTGITQIAVGKTPVILALKADGTVLGAGRFADGSMDIASWSEVKQIAVGSNHALGLRENGSVLYAGSQKGGSTEVSTWRNIVSVAAGKDTSYGVMQNGIVVAAGDNSYGQCGVSSWENITMVSAGNQHAVALRSDGTVVACGDNSYGQCNVSLWSDVVFVSAGAYHTVALRSDGTLLACGRSDSGECAVNRFKSIAAVSAGNGYTLMLFEDGTNKVIGRID